MSSGSIFDWDSLVPKVKEPETRSVFILRYRYVPTEHFDSQEFFDNKEEAVKQFYKILNDEIQFGSDAQLEIDLLELVGEVKTIAREQLVKG
jgi:hypothetical protein